MQTQDTLPISPVRTFPVRIYGSDVRSAALSLFESGLSFRAVSEQLGVGLYTVREWHRAYRKGRFKPDVSPSLRAFDEETKQRVREMRKSGMSWLQIEATTGIHQSTCRRWEIISPASQGIDRTTRSGNMR